MTWLNKLFTFGDSYDPDLDEPRLSTQLEKIKAYLSNNQWHTLNELEAVTGYPQASISSQMRHLRKRKFGQYHIAKRRRSGGRGGTWEYRLMPREEAQS